MKLPPQIPGSPEEFTRAIVLLGNRSKADLRQQQRKELIALLGAYPNQETAAQWKHSLKQLGPAGAFKPKPTVSPQSFVL